MNINVSMKGNDRLANRLGDAVRAQDDMSIDMPPEQTRGNSHVAGRIGAGQSNRRIEGGCLVFVDLSESRVFVADHSSNLESWEETGRGLFTSLSSESVRDTCGALCVPGADAISLARLVRVVSKLSKITRLYSTVVRRAAHAADDVTSNLDALQPICGEKLLEKELSLALDGFVPNCQMRRVIASYTHSHLHMIKLDLVDSIDREHLIDMLHAESRIILGAADDGFSSTADIQEFFRDHGRLRGDRWESFVWEESVLVEGKCVYLMHDISPDEVRIPEVVDAIRRIAMPQLSLADIQRRTDNSLRMLQSFSPILSE